MSRHKKSPSESTLEGIGHAVPKDRGKTPSSEDASTAGGAGTKPARAVGPPKAVGEGTVPRGRSGELEWAAAREGGGREH